MQKLKKILSSFTCMLLLLAFASAIGFEFGHHPASKPRVEISAADSSAPPGYQVIAEDRDDYQKHLASVWLPATLFIVNLLFFAHVPSVICLSRNPEIRPSGNLLYLNFRSLRL